MIKNNYKMRSINQLYRIKEKSTGNYIQLGYNRKSSWTQFPTQVIQNNIDIKDYDKYQVDVFTTNPSSIMTLDKQLIY